MKTIFWNVDTQKDFMDEDGRLSVPGATEIRENLKKLTEFAKENDIQVINTGDWHHANDPELADYPDFKTTFPPHCMAGSEGAKFIPETDPTDPYIIHNQSGGLKSDKMTSRNIIIYKNQFDVFAGNLRTEKVVKAISPDMIIIYGVASDICVNFAVIGILHRKHLGIPVTVVTDAIKGLNEDFDPQVWTGSDRGAHLKTTREVLNGFDGTSETESEQHRKTTEVIYREEDSDSGTVGGDRFLSGSDSVC